jgi:uncharacterized protein with HEPN domain
MQRDNAYLLDIRQACLLVQQFVADMDESGFNKDLKTQSLERGYQHE